MEKRSFIVEQEWSIRGHDTFLEQLTSVITHAIGKARGGNVAVTNRFNLENLRSGSNLVEATVQTF
jgi:hypothetical protein